MKLVSFFASRNAYVFPITIAIKGFVRGPKESLGRDFSPAIGIFKDGETQTYISPKKLNMLGNICFRKILQKPTLFTRKIKKEIEKSVRRLKSFSLQMRVANFSRQNNKKLADWILKFEKFYLDIFTYGSLSVFADESFTDYLQKYLKQKIKNKNLITEYFNKLIVFPRKTYIQQEKRDFLKIVDYIISSKVEKFFKKPIGIINKKLPFFNSRINSLLNNHVRKYGWAFINYEGRERKREDFIFAIKKFLNQKRSLKQFLPEEQRKRKKLIQEKFQIIKKLKIGSKYQKLFEILGLLSWLKDYRKTYCIQAIYYSRPLIKEIAKRFRLSSKEVKFFLPKEIIYLLLGRLKLDKILIKKRSEFAVYFCNERKEYVAVKSEAKNLLKKYKISLNKKKLFSKIIHGVNAYTGLVRGKVKIIYKQADIKKLKEGEIAVARAINPDLYECFKKAAAIVTDEGGITCHAAIVSRELGIPCIIGTKIATKVLKDGDKIEVDASKGIIKILK